MTESPRNDGNVQAVMTRSQKRAKKTFQRLLDKSLEVFGEKGIDAATIEDITNRADLGKGTFYRYFSGKDELVVSLTKDAVRSLLSRVDEGLAGQSTLQDVINALIKAHSSFFLANREKFLLLFQGRLLLKLDREEALGLEEPFADYLEGIERRILVQTGCTVEPMRLRRLVCALAGFVSGFLSFATIGLEESQIEASMGSMRRAFVASMVAFITGSTQNSTVAVVGQRMAENPSDTTLPEKKSDTRNKDRREFF